MNKIKEYRSSLERHNAPYRGVSSVKDYVNFHLSVTHDLFEIYNRSGGNPNIKGHQDMVQDNMSSILEGTKDLSHGTYTAGTITSVVEEIVSLSNLMNWSRPNLTYGEVEKVGARDWLLVPPTTDKGFFEWEHLIRVQPGEKIMIRFKPEDWNPNTVYQFGAKNFDSSGDNFKKLEVDDFNSFTKLSNEYFEYTLRFNEERDVRLAIQTTNSTTGTLGSSPVTLKEFGVYRMEEVEVHTRGLEEDIKPMVENNRLALKHLEGRSY